MKLAVSFFIDLPSGANVRRGAREHIARVKRQREAAKFWLLSESRRQGVVPMPPCVITLTREGVKKVDDHDGLPNSFKHVVDGIACKPTRVRPAGFFEIDDGNPCFTWIYKQVVLPRKQLGGVKGSSRVTIEIEWKEP